MNISDIQSQFISKYELKFGVENLFTFVVIH